MGTSNYDLPLINGLNSAKVPRDFNNLANAVDQRLKNEISRLDTATSSLGSGSPKGTYTTVSALQTAFPNGNNNVYLVSADGKWYYWSGTTWAAGGVYQAASLQPKVISEGLVKDAAVSPIKTDFIRPVKNLFNGVYVNYMVTGDKTSGPVFTSKSTARSVIIPVNPLTTYSIIKGASERFRIALHDKYPLSGETLKRYEKDANTADTEFAQRGSFRVYTFTTQADENYMVLYLSADLSEQPLVQVEPTGTPTQYEPYQLKLNYDIASDKEMLTSNLVRGKNLFDGTYLSGIITGGVGLASEFRTGTGSVAVIPVKVGETYTISKLPSNRFRIAVSKAFPNATIPVDFLLGDSNDVNTKASVTIPTNNSYLIVYVSSVGTPPDFLQIELGNTMTEWESAGYKFSKSAKPYQVGKTPQEYGAVGNANKVSNGSVYTDASLATQATDDTAALQRLFNSTARIIEFPEGKNYLISAPITINVSKPLIVKGNNSKIVVNGDFNAFNITGNSTGSADPSVSGELAKNEMGAIIEGLRMISVSGTSGVALNISSTFGLIVKNCNFHYMRSGIVVNAKNRNMVFESNHIYAMDNYGIHFTDDGDLHQINIFGNHVSYCRVCLFVDNHGMYNMQITGNDFETSLYPTSPAGTKFNMHFKSSSRVLEDIEIVGNTLEDHWYSDGMINFDGATYESITEITVTGNTIGNANGDVIWAKGISRTAIVGNTLKKYRGYALRIKGDLESFVFEGNTASPENGGLITCTGDYYFKQVSLSNNVMSATPTANAIDINVRSIQGTKIIGNLLTLNAMTNYDDTKGLLNITATSSIRRSLFKDNVLTSYNQAVSKSMRVTAQTFTKTVIKNNIAGGFSEANTFELPAPSSTVLVAENM